MTLFYETPSLIVLVDTIYEYLLSCRSQLYVLEECGSSVISFRKWIFCLCVSGILSRNEASVKLLFFLAVSMHGNLFFSFSFLLTYFFACVVQLPGVNNFSFSLKSSSGIFLENGRSWEGVLKWKSSCQYLTNSMKLDSNLHKFQALWKDKISEKI